MSSLFITILNMSLTASYAALIVILIRLGIRKARVPMVFSYALWFVVLFRLVFPFSFESSLSLLPGKIGAISQDIIYSESPGINTGNILLDDTVNHSIQSTLPPIDATASVNSMGAVIQLGAIIWMLGTAALLVYGIISYFRLKQKLSFSTLVKDNIFETDQIKSAFVFGFIKPRIYLPIGLSSQEQAFILMHEQTHIRRLDYLIKPLALVVLVLHWFNPLIWISYFLMIKDMEISCDERVMKLSNDDLRIDYSKTLLALASKQSGLSSRLFFGESNVKTRVRNILHFKRPVIWVSVIVTVMVAVLSISLLANPAKDKEIEEQIVILQGEASDIYSVYDGNLIKFTDYPIGKEINTFILEVENMLFQVEPSDFEKYGGRMVEIEYLNTNFNNFSEIESITDDGKYTKSKKQRKVYAILSISGDPYPAFD